MANNDSFLNELFGRFDPNFIGFDRLFNDMLEQHNRFASRPGGFPPYNVRQVESDRYLIELALAGFSRQDIIISMQGDVLHVEGSKSEKGQDPAVYVHRGIAQRSFKHSFRLAEGVEIETAKLADGILTIELKRTAPVEPELRIIEIN